MKIKICGLTSPKEAEYLNRNHVDYAGMVLFFPKSRRNISLERAKEIMAELDPAIQKVAVLVSPAADQVRAVESAGFDVLQAHGEISEDIWRLWKKTSVDDRRESREVLSDFPGLSRKEADALPRKRWEDMPADSIQREELHIPIWKAFNVKDMDHYAEYHENMHICGYVFDAAIPGSGKTFDWNLVKSIPRDGKQFLLAGGLNPENVQSAIRALHPDGVDVSSGVEKPGGGKDGRRIDEFVAAVRRE